MSRECLGVRVGCVEGVFRLALVIRVSKVRDRFGESKLLGRM